MKSKLKLFVWIGFAPDYTDGLAFALAKDEDEARKLIEKYMGHGPSEWGELTIYPIHKKIGRGVSGGG